MLVLLGDGAIMGNVSLVPLLGNFVGCLCRASPNASISLSMAGIEVEQSLFLPIVDL